MKITLAKIKEHNPCADGWEQILAAQGPDLDREWPLVEALESNGLDDVLWALRCLPEYNDLWRKYAVWCAKQVQHLLTDQRSEDALEVAWMHSNGQATDAELTAARAAAVAAAWDAKAAAGAAARAAARAAAIDAASAAALASLSDAAWAAAVAARYAGWAAAGEAAIDAASGASYAASAARAAARAAQKDKLIQILTAGEWVEEDDK